LPVSFVAAGLSSSSSSSSCSSSSSSSFSFVCVHAEDAEFFPSKTPYTHPASLANQSFDQAATVMRFASCANRLLTNSSSSIFGAQ
jgi:hypothetical protein